jgi:hypothetical protein
VTAPNTRLQRWEPWLWVIVAFVTWNVVFDREVAVAAIEFTREQILRYDQGEPVRTIEGVFRPQVGRAALVATVSSALVVGGGLVVRRLVGRFRRRPS